MTRHSLLRLCVLTSAILGLISCGGGGSASDSGGGSGVSATTGQAVTGKALANSYVSTNLVANNSATYKPTIGSDKSFIDAWGVAIRPAGQPGHFWVLAGNKSFEYVGDVMGKTTSPCTASSVLCADLPPLPSNVITFPDFPLDVSTGQPDIVNNHATGVVFNPTATSFVISQTPAAASTNTATVTAGAKFLFATNYGAIYGWTERKHADGSGYDRSDTGLKIFDSRDNPADCGQFYGLAVSPTSSRLYAADFGTDTSICSSPEAIAGVPASFKVRVFDKTLNASGKLQEITKTLNGGKPFVNPFAANPENIKAGDYVPWNVQVIGAAVFVAYAQVQQNPDAPVGTPWPAKEVHAPGAGRLASFDLDGKLMGVWDDGGLLNAPWGLALAPANFGSLSGMLLVGNFGDGDAGGAKGGITALDPNTRKAVNYMRNPDGSPLLVPGVWGLVFGNGDTLGDANALYYAAGPNGELDGLFGSLRYSPPP